LVAKRDCNGSFNFKFNINNGSIYLGKFPGKCVDNAGNQSTQWSNLVIWDCNGSEAQKFDWGQNRPESKTNQIKVINSYKEYEYWIMVIKDFDLHKLYIGHAWNVIIQRTVTKFSDGSTSYQNWETLSSYSYNPGKNLTFSQSFDMNLTRDYLNGNNHNGKLIARKSRISEDRATWIRNNPNMAGCKEYSAKLQGENCSCIDYATRSWHVISSKWEDMRPQALFFNTPHELYDTIKYFNEKGEFLDNGKTWN
jgi:hypothetical protein